MIGPSVLAVVEDDPPPELGAFLSSSILEDAVPLSTSLTSRSTPFSDARVERKFFCLSVAGSPPVAHVFGSGTDDMMLVDSIQDAFYGFCNDVRWQRLQIGLDQS